MKYIENFYSKCAIANGEEGASGGPQFVADSDDEPVVNEYEEDYIICQVNNGSSILMLERDGSELNL